MKFPQVDRSKLLHKNDALLELLATHHTVNVHVDTRHPGVFVPVQLKGQPQVMFQLGLNLPTHYLKVEDTGWSATLSFNRRQFTCVVPWAAVWAIVGEATGLGAHWPSDIPIEIQRRMEEEARVNGTHPRVSSPAPDKSSATARVLPKGWKVIQGGKKDDASDPCGPKAS
jgi:hypothetical protein